MNPTTLDDGPPAGGDRRDRRAPQEPLRPKQDIPLVHVDEGAEPGPGGQPDTARRRAQRGSPGPPAADADTAYGVQTTGPRTSSPGPGPWCPALKARGHDVHILFRRGLHWSPEWLDPVFEPWSVRRGLTFVTRRGRISHLATMLQLRFGEMERDIYAFDTAGAGPDRDRLRARHGADRLAAGHSLHRYRSSLCIRAS